MGDKINKVRVVHYPLYSTVRAFMQIIEGRPKGAVTGLRKTINEQWGTPQNPVDWSDPDTWIPERLSGEHAELAKIIWEQGNKHVNPRYLLDSNLLISNFTLLDTDSMGIYLITDRGRRFLKNDEKVVAELDKREGLLQLLSILSTKTRAKRADILPEWSEFLVAHSGFEKPLIIQGALRHRLLNLAERGLTKREGNTYAITQKGLDYLGSREVADPKKDIMRSLNDYNKGQVEALRERLGKMQPSAFEYLVRDLLEAMGYDDVTVTKESGDKGVDVIATIQFGITTITEVVQVKRHQSGIGRPTLDQLRGALPYHKALRGTLITLGSFSKGCTEAALFPGAAPITLIDGETLLDLLIEHGIGVRKRDAMLYDIDEEYFVSPSPEDELE